METIEQKELRTFNLSKAITKEDIRALKKIQVIILTKNTR
jgi:hypothetical protein